MEDLVSVIVPTYNASSFILDTLISIQNQTYKNWECIIIDDGSTDNTYHVIEHIMVDDNRFKYQYQTNIGLSASRNAGILKSKGIFVLFLDSDDLINKHKIKAHLNYHSQFPVIDISYGNALYFYDKSPENLFLNKNNSNIEWMLKVQGYGNEILTKLFEQNMMVVSSPIIKKKVIDKIGGFDSAFTSLEDWDYWIRLAINNCYFYHINEDCASTYIRLSSNSMSMNGLRMHKNHYNLLNKYKKYKTASLMLKEKRIFYIKAFFAKLIKLDFEFKDFPFIYIVNNQ